MEWTLERPKFGISLDDRKKYLDLVKTGIMEVEKSMFEVELFRSSARAEKNRKTTNLSNGDRVLTNKTEGGSKLYFPGLKCIR